MVENWTVLVVCTRVWTQEEDGGRRSQDTQAGTLGGGRDTGTLVGGGGTRVGCYRDTLGGFQNVAHPHIWKVYVKMGTSVSPASGGMN